MRKYCAIRCLQMRNNFSMSICCWYLCTFLNWFTWRYLPAPHGTAATAIPIIIKWILHTHSNMKWKLCFEAKRASIAMGRHQFEMGHRIFHLSAQQLKFAYTFWGAGWLHLIIISNSQVFIQWEWVTVRIARLNSQIFNNSNERWKCQSKPKMNARIRIRQTN